LWRSARAFEIEGQQITLPNGGKESQSGWLKDKFGLSGQIVPRVLPAMLQDKDPKKRDGVMRSCGAQNGPRAIAALQRAHDLQE
jgi:predicted 3-demethylubiquinone-9 3-methyltransferase (glyoxalase superfamily)